MPSPQTSKPAPLHTDSMAYAARVNDGKIPAGWSEAVSEGVAQANVIAALAHEKIRGVDPPFVACSFAHREKLVAEIEAILKVGAPIEEARTPFIDAALILIAEVRAHLDRAGQLQLTGETVEQGDN